MGSAEDWAMATDSLKAALEELNLPYVINEGDGAFYGPKIEDVYKRQPLLWLKMVQPKRKP